MIPAILSTIGRVAASGAGRNAAGQYVAAGIGGKLRKSGMGALKRSIRSVPGHLAKASGASSNPLFNKVVDAAKSGYGAVQDARKDQARRQARNAADRARRASRRGDKGDPQQAKEDMNAKAQETDARRETAEQDNIARQEKAHQQGTIEIAKESNGAITAMANDIAIIREKIEGDGGQKQEEGSFLGNLTKVLLGVFVGGVGLLQAKLQSMIGDWAGKLGLKTIGNAANRVGGFARRAQEILGGANNPVARLGSAMTSGTLGSAIKAGSTGLMTAGGPLGILNGATAKMIGPTVNAAGRATGTPAAMFGKVADAASHIEKFGTGGARYMEKNGGTFNPLKSLDIFSSANAATRPVTAGMPPKSVAAASTSTLSAGSSSSPTAALVRSAGSSATSSAGTVQLLAEMLDHMTSSSKGIYTRASDEMLFGQPNYGSISPVSAQSAQYQPKVSSISPGGNMANPPRRQAGPFSGFGADVDGYIKESSSMYGIPEDVLRGFVKMEGGWTGAMSPTGAIGTGQFTQRTWDSLSGTAEGKAIGMRRIGSDFRTANDPRHDKRVNTLATGLLAKQNADMLKRAGLPVTGENLYMMHNIGPGVIPALKGQPVTPATEQAMRLNGMKPGMSATDFVAFQKDRFQSHYASANSISVAKPNMAEIVQEASAARKAPAVPTIIPPPVVSPGNAKSPPQGGQAQMGAQTPMITRNPDSPVRSYSQRLIGQSISA